MTGRRTNLNHYLLHVDALDRVVRIEQFDSDEERDSAKHNRLSDETDHELVAVSLRGEIRMEKEIEHLTPIDPLRAHLPEHMQDRPMFLGLHTDLGGV